MVYRIFRLWGFFLVECLYVVTSSSSPYESAPVAIPAAYEQLSNSKVFHYLVFFCCRKLILLCQVGAGTHKIAFDLEEYLQTRKI